MDSPSTAGRLERRGRYRVEGVLGRGGMGTVYEVLHEGLGRRFALKVLHSPGASAVARLEREAQALARLHHPHVVAPVDFGVEDGEPYLVMELAVGETLAGRLARAGRLEAAEIAAIFLPICSAVGAAHRIGIIHRDLKPSNVMLAEGLAGQPFLKLLDFGVARSTADLHATLSGGGVHGTVAYLPPEVARGEGDPDERSDVYSLGVMLFECATGRLPFEGETSYAVMHAIVTSPTPPPSSVESRVTPAFDALVAAALAKRRADRVPSAHALGTALLAFADEATRALWAREFGNAAGGDAPARPSGSAGREMTLTEDCLAAIGTPRLSHPPRRWLRRDVAWAAFAAALLVLVPLVRLRHVPQEAVPSTAASAAQPPGPSTDSSGPPPALPTASSASLPPAPAPPPPSPSLLPALPRPPLAPRRADASGHPPAATASASAAPRAAAKAEWGTNGAPIFE